VSHRERLLLWTSWTLFASAGLVVVHWTAVPIDEQEAEVLQEQEPNHPHTGTEAPTGFAERIVQESASPEALAPSIRGEVRSFLGDPIGGAIVVAEDVSGNFPAHEAVTDSEGSFVMAIERFERPVVFKVSLRKSGAWWAPEQSVTVQPERTHAPIVFVCYRHTRLVQGVVTNPMSNPIPNAQIQSGDTVATSNHIGEFQLAAMEVQGVLRLRASARGYRPVRVPIVMSQHSIRVRLVLEEAGTVVLRGQVLNESGQAINHATIRMFGANDMLTTKVRDNGQYSMELMTGSSYLVNIEATKYRMLAEKLETSDIEIVDRNFVMTRGCTLRGRVLSAMGNPACNASVWAVEPPGPPRKANSYAQTQTDADGYFEMPGLFAGPTYVCASAAMGAGYQVFHIDEQSIDFVEISLSDLAICAGVVRDKNERPVGGVIVRTEPLGHSSATTADGRFRVPYSGESRIHFLCPGYARLTITPQPDTEVVLEAAGMYVGRVVDSRNSLPVSSVVVRLRRASHAPDGIRPASAWGGDWDRGVLSSSANGEFCVVTDSPVGTAIGMELAAPGYDTAIVPYAILRRSSEKPLPEHELVREGGP
jgi:hypothetical protein